MFLWNVGVEHDLHKDAWYVTALLFMMFIAVVVLFSTLKGIV